MEKIGCVLAIVVLLILLGLALVIIAYSMKGEPISWMLQSCSFL